MREYRDWRFTEEYRQMIEEENEGEEEEEEEKEELPPEAWLRKRGQTKT